MGNKNVMPEETIIYEQPLNEHIRVCLRLEHLFSQIDQHINNESPWSSRISLIAILETLNVIDRPDLKTKLTKALTQHASTLTQLEMLPQVDSAKLRQILNELDRLIDSLYTTQGKIGQPLRNNEFLNAVRQHLYNPGGATNFSVPSLFLWLQKSPEERLSNLRTWLKEFDQLRNVVEILLRLTRQSTNPVERVAESGFYRQALDSNIPYELIGVSVPLNLNVYPEISVGRHGMSIRFCKFDDINFGKPKQTEHPISFTLFCCAL